MSSTPQVSVLIATCDRRELLRLTLDSLFAQDFPPDRFEIVVVVDGSTDGTAEYLQGVTAPCTFRFFKQENQGQFRALNRALRVARGDIVLFLDDDTTGDRNLLAEHARAHAPSGSILVYGPIVLDPESPTSLVTDWVRSYTHELAARSEKGNVCGWPREWGVHANTSVRRQHLLESGGFDERFLRTLANIELALRLKKRGLEIRYCRDAVVHHRYVKTSAELIRADAESFGRNELLLSRVHRQYRPHSALARIASGSMAKRLWLAAAVRSPFSLDGLLAIPYRLMERGRGAKPMRRSGIRLVELRKALFMYRSATKAAGSWDALRSEFGRRVPVLGYHHVGPAAAGPFGGLTVDPARFERHMHWLRRHGYTGIRPADWLAWRNEGRRLPDKPVVITFDDGYADLGEYALPILEKLNFGAAVYVVTSQIGGTNKWDQRLGSVAHTLMNDGQIRTWAARGIEFGSHTRTHADLSALSASDLRDEIEGSVEDLSVLLGKPPTSFAYPFGRWDGSAREHVARSFAIAYTCDATLNGLFDDPYVLGRAMVESHDSIFDLKCRVTVGFSPISRMVRTMRERVRLRSRIRFAAQRYRQQTGGVKGSVP